MARLSEAEKRAIIERDKPGHVVIDGSEVAGVLDSLEQRPASQSPDLKTLRAKVTNRSEVPDTDLADVSSTDDLSGLRELFFSPTPGPGASANVGEGPIGATNRGLRARGNAAAIVSKALDSAGARADASADSDEDEIVPVRRRISGADPFDAVAQQAKGVVISGSRKRVIGEQG